MTINKSDMYDQLKEIADQYPELGLNPSENTNYLNRQYPVEYIRVPQNDTNPQGSAPELDFGPQGMRNPNDNYGFMQNTGWTSLLGLLPNGAVMAGVAKGAINQNNHQAIREAQKSIPGMEVDKPSLVKDILTNPKDGQVGKVNLNGNNYQVGFLAQDPTGRTNLTPMEARERSLLQGYVVEDKPNAVPLGQVEKAPLNDPTNPRDFTQKDNDLMTQLSANVFSPGNSGPHGVVGPNKQNDMPDKSMHHGLGLFDLSPTFKEQIESTGTQGKISTFDRTGLSDKTKAMADQMAALGYGDLGVNSGYRSAGHNADVGGARGSQHIQGNAIDLATSRLSPEQKSAVLDAALSGGAKGIGVYPGGGLHVDTRENVGMWGPYGYSNPGKTPEQKMDNFFKAAPEWSKDNLQALRDANGFAYLPSGENKNVPTPVDKPTYDETVDKGDRDSFSNKNQQTGLGFLDNVDNRSTESSKPQAIDTNQNVSRVTDNLDSDTKSLMGMTLAGEIDPSRTDLSTEAGRREAMGILSTMENRASKYDGDISKAIQAPNQYSTWNNQAAANTASKNYEQNKTVFDTLVSDYISNPQNNLGFTSYHADFVNPGWSKSMQNKEQIGPHTFGFLPEYSNAKQQQTTVQPHTVFNTTAQYAPHMTGVVSEVNANKDSNSKGTQSTNSSSNTNNASKSSATSSTNSGPSGGSGFMSTDTASNPSANSGGKSSNSSADKGDKD